jgi:hypothetical protein
MTNRVFMLPLWIRLWHWSNALAVICQGSCPVTQAAFFSFLSSCLTGLSHTVAGRSQFRVVPRQRPGLAALAFS